MSSLHEQIMREGTQGLLSQVTTQQDRAVISAAAKVNEIETHTPAFTHAAFCLTCLPHRRCTEKFWTRANENTTLVISAGRTKSGQELDVPFGITARLILLNITTAAVRNSSRIVELGPNMHQWLTSMGISKGGRSRELVRSQARNISAARLDIFLDDGNTEARQSDTIVTKALNFSDGSNDWVDTIELSEHFYELLKDNYVAVPEETIQTIKGQSGVMDVYLWLAYTLHKLDKPILRTWAQLNAHFAQDWKHQRLFKKRFLNWLAYAEAIYPQAKIERTPEGIKLFPSRPPLDKRRVVAFGKRPLLNDVPQRTLL